MAKQVGYTAPLNRKQLSRRDKERIYRRWLFIGAGVLVGLVALVMGWGLYDQYVAKPARPVATVRGTQIRLDTYQRLVRYRRADHKGYLDQLQSRQKQMASSADESQSFLVQYIDQQITQVQQRLYDLPTAALDELIDELLIRQETGKRGITATADEVQANLEKQFGFDRNPPTPTPAPITATVAITVTPTPTTAPMTEAQFLEESKTFFATSRQKTGFSEPDFRHLVETGLLRGKLEDAIKAEAPTSGEQVNARHILLKTKEEAEAALARLKAGEDFAALAAELSTDTSNKDKGGDLGWFGRGAMVEGFEQVAFALQPGQLSDVVETSFGFHIIRVDERDANRAYEASSLTTSQDKAVEDWFTAQRALPEVVRSWNSTMIPVDLASTAR